MPSFSYTVKEELCSEITDRDKKYACLYGMLISSKHFDFDKIVFQTKNDKVFSLFKELILSVSKNKSALKITEKANKIGIFTYSAELVSDVEREHILNRYKYFNGDDTRKFISENIDINNLPAFLIGLFLASGSVIDPNKEYHLEFVTPFSEIAEEIKNLLIHVGVSVKLSERKGFYIVYLKESESIEDLLTYMGATMSSLEIMNVKILKDVRNKANRISNCDTANIEKSIAAAAKQVEDIEFIEKTIGFGSLSEDLREIAEIRLENPDYSLRELGQALEKPISRSGVNHRMKKLSAIAEDIRSNKYRS
ncbi:MAG: DNA-binding protein WhiA [Oscillospiraceae bacterium]|nr:DNA-binding protein WhiA [Oscillospiraceae bacterium]